LTNNPRHLNSSQTELSIRPYRLTTRKLTIF